MGTKEKKHFLKKAGIVLECIFIFLSLLVATTVAWVFRTWNGLTMEEMVFHLQAPTQGTDSNIIVSFLLTCLLVSAVLTVLIVILYRKIKWAKDIVLSSIAVLFLAVAAFSVGYMWNRLDITAYAKNQNTESSFIEENYADPQSVQLTFPEKKRNLIYIYLESMENTYADKASGGDFDTNVIPELTEISMENENFSGDSKTLNGGVPMYGSTWTMGALFAQSSALPLNLPIRGDLMSTQKEFLPGVTVLGDILEDAGYRQYFLMGSDAAFAGRDLYYTKHGNYELYDYYYSLEQKEIPDGYHVFWGYEDKRLFEFAKEHLTEISKTEEPFHFSMLTVDTHFEDGYRCEDCPDTYGDDQYANVMACSSKQVSEFLKWIQEQEFYENTTVVITGDHLTMDSNFCKNVEDSYTRKVYTTYMNAAVTPEKKEYREYTTMDHFPTTLASLGVTIAGNRLGLGTNLFSAEETLLEKYGKEKFDTGLNMKSAFMDELSKDIVVEDAKKVQEEEAAEAARKEIHADVEVTDYDPVNDSFDVILTNVECQLNIESIQSTVWEEDGMKALVWYEAQQEEDGSYRIQVKGSDLAHKAGTYQVLLYGKLEGYEPYVFDTVNGTIGTIGKGEGKINAAITVEPYDFRKGYFEVKLDYVRCSTPIEKIQCTVWEEDGQEALKTYDAVLLGDGSYRIRVKAVDFHFKVGKYRLLIYGQPKGEGMTLIDEVIGEITG